MTANGLDGTRALLVPAIAGALVSLQFVLGGSAGAATGSLRPRTARDVLARVMIADLAVLATLTFEDVVVAVAIVAALAAGALLGRERGLMLVLGAACVANVVEAAARETVPSIAVLRIGGPRFVVPWAIGVAVASATVAAGLALDRVRRAPGRAVLIVPALGVVYGFAVAGRGRAPAIAFRRDALPGTPMSIAAVTASALVLGALLLRRDLIDRGFWARPNLRAALLGCVGAAVLCAAILEHGLVVAAALSLTAVVVAMTVLLGPEVR